MVEEVPEIDTFVTIVANFHRRSMGKSPGGRWGFPTETGLPFVQHDNDFQDTWEALFTNMMRRMFDEEEVVHGQNDELDKLKDDLFGIVMPRLLRPLETGDHPIKPCLIHTDLWPGNILPDVETDKLMVYDSRAMWGHNECDLATWRAARFSLGPAYVSGYQKKMGISEPQGDWMDRHALYAL